MKPHVYKAKEGGGGGVCVGVYAVTVQRRGTHLQYGGGFIQLQYRGVFTQLQYRGCIYTVTMGGGGGYTVTMGGGGGGGLLKAMI